MTTCLRILDRDALPTPKDEQWKYTHLGRALGARLLNVQPLAQQQILVHKTVGEICKEPEKIVWKGEAGNHYQSRFEIVLEDGAQATIVEFHEGEGAYWKNMSTEIVLGANARLNHIRIQKDSVDAVQTNMVHISMERDSHLNSFSINLGGKLTRHDIHAVLNGSGAQCQLNGVNLLKGQQHGDTTIIVEHVAPHCVSNQFYRSLLDDKAHGVFQGKVHVHRGAQKTDGYQLANTILLSPMAKMATKPELEIYADDVKCSHGTTTGALDEEPLFYLRSRGLNESQARMLLIQAFIDEVIGKITDSSIQTRIKDMVAEWLKKQLN
ncbi:MAG: Fe-S cluster assembly protein SufD [Alphaproteobacteria bacterium]|nr:Fe-S cluster assembly protein SufD [Alphaproteobacteria bacterium]